MGFVTRRRFLQGSAAVGSAALGHRLLFGTSSTLVPAAYEHAAPGLEDSVFSTCWIGKQDCGMIARRVDGRVVKLDGDPGHPRNLGALCPKGQAQIASLYDPNRVKTPLIRTNAKGETGRWREASWDEALAIVAEKANEVRAEDPSLVLWQKGRSKAKSFYDNAFVHATGATKLGHGAYCSDAGYRALEYTTGLHGVLHPDFRHANYVLSWGWNITNAGGNKFCWITWPRELLAARERGMKVVHLDPRLRSAGPHADRWLAIKPGTDLAFALALCNSLVAQGFVDREYLARHTNAAFLVRDDGTVLRDDAGTELVWDEDDTAKPLADATAPVLEGSFDVGEESVRPAFEVFKEHIAGSTPEWAAGVCGVSSEQIERIATELGEEARIGSTIVVEGKELPYRPVGIMAYHMSQQELGFQALRAMTMVTMLVGAVGAVGGQFTDFDWKVDKNYEPFGDLEVKEGPYPFTLKGSKFFPINTGMPGVVAKVMADPERYEVEQLPRVAILHMVNPLAAFPDRKAFVDTYGKFEFVAVISPWLSETADYFADVVLPAATMEKYEGPITADDAYSKAKTMRLPVMDPLFDTRGEIDIYLDLAEAMGVLFGDEGYLAEINAELELPDDLALSLDEKPTVREIFDRWARAQDLEGGIEFFEKNGVWHKGARAAEDMYGYATDPPFGGALHRFYGESLLKVQQAMRGLGADEIYWRDYTAYPTWRELTMDGSPSKYDLTLISYKLVEQKQSRTSFNPLLAELTPRQRIDINPETAKRRGIGDGDLVLIESHNAVTGETRTAKVHAAYTEGMRPDTVGMPHHFGLWTHPVSDGMGASANALFFTGEGYWTNTADQSYHVKVSVAPTGGEPSSPTGGEQS